MELYTEDHITMLVPIVFVAVAVLLINQQSPEGRYCLGWLLNFANYFLCGLPDLLTFGYLSAFSVWLQQDLVEQWKKDEPGPGTVRDSPGTPRPGASRKKRRRLVGEVS